MTGTSNPEGWRLFLDDERFPSDDFGIAVIARDVDEAIRVVQLFGVPDELSLDHDLGQAADGLTKPTAMRFLWWLIDEFHDDRLDLLTVKRVVIHSQNPIGARNLKGLWDGFAADIDSSVLAELKPHQG